MFGFFLSETSIHWLQTLLLLLKQSEDGSRPLQYFLTMIFTQIEVRSIKAHTFKKTNRTKKQIPNWGAEHQSSYIQKAKKKIEALTIRAKKNIKKQISFQFLLFNQWQICRKSAQILVTSFCEKCDYHENKGILLQKEGMYFKLMIWLCLSNLDLSNAWTWLI